jgi:hypothetical protein
MKETPQQYTQRILSYIEGKEPLAVQAATAERLSQLIKGVSTSELRRRPAPEKWSVSEIIAHLADSEIIIGFRLRFIPAPRAHPSSTVIRINGQPADTTTSAIRRSRWNYFVCCVNRILLCLNPSSPSSGSSTECIPSAARNRSNKWRACTPATTSITCSKSKRSSRGSDHK